MPEEIQSNGLLSQLVGMKAQKQAQDKQNAIQTYKQILDSDSASEGMRQYAGNSLLSLIGTEFGGGKGAGGGGGKSGGAGNPILEVFKHVIGHAVKNGGKGAQAGQQQQSQANSDDPGAPGQTAAAGQKPAPQGKQAGSGLPAPGDRFLTREQIQQQQLEAGEKQASVQAKIDAVKAQQKLLEDAAIERQHAHAMHDGEDAGLLDVDGIGADADLFHQR